MKLLIVGSFILMVLQRFFFSYFDFLTLLQYIENLRIIAILTYILNISDWGLTKLRHSSGYTSDHTVVEIVSYRSLKKTPVLRLKVLQSSHLFTRKAQWLLRTIYKIVGILQLLDISGNQSYGNSNKISDSILFDFHISSHSSEYFTIR